MHQALAISKRLAEMEVRRHELLIEITASLALKKLWPEAYAHGAVRTMVQHKTYGNDQNTYLIIIQEGDHDRKKIPMNDAPDDLKQWPSIARALKSISETGHVPWAAGHQHCSISHRKARS